MGRPLRGVHPGAGPRPGRARQRPGSRDASSRTWRSGSCAGSPRRPPSRARTRRRRPRPSIPVRSGGGGTGRAGSAWATTRRGERPPSVRADAGSLPARRSAAWSLVFRGGVSPDPAPRPAAPLVARQRLARSRRDRGAADRRPPDRASAADARDPDHRRRPRLRGPSERPVLVDEEHRGGRLGRGRPVRTIGPALRGRAAAARARARRRHPRDVDAAAVPGEPPVPRGRPSRRGRRHLLSARPHRRRRALDRSGPRRPARRRKTGQPVGVGRIV